MYKLIKNIYGGESQSILRLSDNACIPFDPANTDYQAFKQDIADGAELQDADGNVVADAQAYVAGLP